MLGFQKLLFLETSVPCSIKTLWINNLQTPLYASVFIQSSVCVRERLTVEKRQAYYAICTLKFSEIFDSLNSD
jgi:hypothetical protein